MRRLSYQVEVALGSTILLFLVPQVPEEFCRGWPMPCIVVIGKCKNLQDLGVEYRQAAGRFARYDDVRRAILQLQNTFERMFAAKRDYNDDEEKIRSELDRDLKKLLKACDQANKTDKLRPWCLCWWLPCEAASVNAELIAV